MKRHKPWIAIVISFLMLCNLLITDSRSYSQTPKEVSERTNNWKTSFYYLSEGDPIPIVENGVISETRPGLHFHAKVKLQYSFDIPNYKGTPNALLPGDYIDIPLPAGQFLKLPREKQNLNYTENDRQKKVAEYEVIDVGGQETIRVTFLPTILDKDQYTGVNIAVTGTFHKSGDGFAFPLNPRSPTTDYYSAAVAAEDTHLGYERWYTKPLIKDYYTDVHYPGQVIWRLIVNTDMAEKLTKNRTQVNSQSTSPIPTSNDVVIVDHLPPGTGIEEVGLRVSMFMTTPDKNPKFPSQPAGEMSWSAGGNFDLNPVLFRKLTLDSTGKTLEQFKAELVASGKSDPEKKPVWAVYQTETNQVVSNILVAWLGDVPHSNWTYQKVYENSVQKVQNTYYPEKLEDYFEGHLKYLTPDQIKRLKQVYTNSDGGVDVPVVSWTLMIRNKPQEGMYGHYYNHAQIEYTKADGQPFLDETDKLFNHVSTDSSIDSAEKVKISLTVKKKWIGEAKGHALVQLYGDNEPVGNPIELNEINAWRWTYRGLNKFGTQKEIKYEIREINPPEGYEISYQEIPAEQFRPDAPVILVVTNKKLINTEKTSVSVEKKWSSGEKDKVYVILFANNQERERVVLSAANDWKHTFENLPKYSDDSGTAAFQYTVTEVPVEGFDSSQVATDKNGIPHIVITNTKKPDPLQVPDPSQTPNPTPSPSPDVEGTTDPTEVRDSGVDYFPPVSTTTTTSATLTTTITTTTTTTTTSSATTTSTSATSTATSNAGGGDSSGGDIGGGSEGSDYFAPTTTRDPLFDIDDDDAARGNAKRKKKGEAGSEEEEEDETGVSGESLPNTGNLPNNLFYAVGAFVSVLGLLVLMLQKLRV